YASAVASQVPELGVGLGALNPFTRHPVLIAMTVSALDEMAPGRIRLGLGSALPLRLGQMGIPYAPDDAATRTVSTIETLRTLWKGERVPPGKPGLPPLQPMFAPVHRVPIYVAGYRSPMMVVAGEKGDGYIARPAESIPGLRKLLRVMDRAARAAGRDPDAIDVAGYLLTFVDETRRDALNRAKRARRSAKVIHRGCARSPRRHVGDRATVLVHRIDRPRRGGRRARRARRRVRSGALPRIARRRRRAARRHECHERDL